MGDLGSVEFDLAHFCGHSPSIGVALSIAPGSALPAPPTRLYLASTSPARLATLRAAGIEPIVIPSEVDEDAAVAAAETERGASLSAEELVLLLARLKAEAVAGAGTDPSGAPLDGLVLGGDSAFAIDGAIHGKPHEPERARARWHAQRGRQGVLHSGHWLIRMEHGRAVAATGAVSSATVTFVEDLDDDELEAYLATGEPLSVAGAFTLDARGGAFIERIDGDPHTVVGLGLPALRRLVRELGVSWHSLWNRG